MNGKQIFLRALEPEDLEFLYRLENDPLTWSVSDSLAPFSKHLLTQYLENAHLDIYTTKQLRFIIAENETRKPIGTIDLYDFEPTHLRAGVGVLIEEQYRTKGFASEALDLLHLYCANILNMHQVFANIAPNNQKSIALFEKNNYQLIGIKRNWRRHNHEWIDELFYQKML